MPSTETNARWAVEDKLRSNSKSELELETEECVSG